MKKEKLNNGMKKKIGIFTVVLFSMIALGSAQTSTITDAESNLTDSQIDVEFTDLPEDEDLVVESLGDDTTEVTDFTSESNGAATVTWRHNPFEDGTSLVDDGWTYRVRDDSGDFNYEFEISHGNMLLGLDTFEDESLNENIWDDQSEVNSNVVEEDGVLELDSCSGCGDYLRLFSEDAVSSNEVLTFSAKNDGGESGDPDITVYAPTKDDGIGSFDLQSELETDSYSTVKLYRDDDDGEIVYEVDGEEVDTISTSEEEFYIRIASFKDTLTTLESYSKVPKISKDAFEEPNEFGNQEETLVFEDFLQNDNGSVGLEFSNDADSWDTTPPSNGDSLYYRNTDNGTLNSVAVDTSQTFENLEIDALRPENNTARVIDDDVNEVTEEFAYEIMYNPDTDERRDLFVAWTLDDEDGNEVDSSTYPGETLDEGNDEYFNDFSEETEIGTGEYEWTIEFRDNDLFGEGEGQSTFRNYNREILSESDAPVSFNLTSPEQGQEITSEELEDGSYTFEYSADINESGTLELWIPQEDTDPVYEESVDSDTSESVSLDLDSGVEDYEWYLVFEENDTETRYQSEIIDFSTEADPDDDDDDDDDNGDEEPTFDIEEKWINFMDDYFGVGEDNAIIVAGVLVVVSTSVLFFSLAGTVGGLLGIPLGIMIAGILELLPGWTIMALLLIAAGILGKFFHEVLGD